MEQFTKQTKLVEETISLQSMLKKQVVTPKGSILGKVKEIRIQEGTCHLEGIIVKKGVQKPFFVSKDYIKHISLDAIMLTEELTNQYLNAPVISFAGHKIGTVCEIYRVQNSNIVDTFVVRKRGLFGRKIQIPITQVHQLGASIILKENV
ncbi:MAG: PRC-barrel domain-containing protein [Candidatus Woesearchaeota archaeon]